MKIIDQTPLVNEKGQISLLDKIKATLKFGSSWLSEIQGQKVVMETLGRTLDQGYTLLRNIPLSADGPSIPMILVGPTGIYMLYTTPLTGMYRAKGDSWGTISGNAFKSAQPNLLVRTVRMARAVQVFIQKQGISSLLNVEGVLLAADPGLHIASVRPIVRVVMRDALERFAISITQARVLLSSDVSRDFVDRLVNPRPEQKLAPERPLAVESAPAVPPPPEAELGALPSWSKEFPAILPKESQPGLVPAEGSPFVTGEPAFIAPLPESPLLAAQQGRARFSGRQWALLAAFGVIEFIVIAVLIYLVLSSM